MISTAAVINRRHTALLILLAIALLGAFLEPAPAQPPGEEEGGAVTVVSSPLVEKWFAQDGIAFARRTGPGLGAAPVTKTRLLILPLETVGGPGAAKMVTDYVAKGGKLLAVYWGTVTAAEANVSPTYHLIPVLGVKPIAWLSAPPQPLTILSTGPGLLPYAGRDVTLARTPAVQMEAQPGTAVIGRWAEENGSRAGAVFLRGNVMVVAAHLLRQQNDVGEARDVFFWAVQRLAKDIGPGMQARDRIQQAVGAYAGLSGQLNANSPPAVRGDAAAAQDALAEARSLLAAGRAARATIAADRSRAYVTRGLERLKEAGP